MDAAALTALLSQSTEKLVGLHARIGHPPEALQGALDALHQALKTAVDDQIGKVQREAQDLSEQCRTIEAENAAVRRALGEKGACSPLSLQNAVGKRMVSAASSSSASASTSTSPDQATQSSFSEDQDSNLPPLLQRRAQLQAEQHRLKTQYATRHAQLERLLAKLNTYVPMLGSFVKIPQSHQHGHIPADVSASSPDSSFVDVSQPRIASIEAEIIRCSKEVNARSERLQTSLLEIVQLWSELCLEPCQPVALGDEQVFESERTGDQINCGGSTLAFDRNVLTHLQLEPIHDERGVFAGEFITTETHSTADPSSSQHGSRAVDILADTPTRASMGGVMANSRDDMVLHLPATSKSGPASASTLPAHLLEPSEQNLALAAEKLRWLEAEKQRREMRIQDLYDELSELWAKFDVPEDEMDAFVMDHRGSTLDVVEAYQAELEKMKQLKAQHMSLFILKTRERIATLWDSLFLTPEEREASFPPFFIDVSGETDPGLDEPLPTDEILASHEQMIDHLTEQVRTKAPVLKVIGKYKELLDEARQLDESAADGSRLLGRSNRGDPGRLLREEKMRKRVKIQKPKIEAELLKVIPAWEEEHGEPFTINGVRYLDELLEQMDGSRESAAARKRTRTVSAAQPSVPPTPATATRRGPLAPSSVSNRGVSSATPMRPITPHQGTLKKPRLAPPSTASSTTARTPATRSGAVLPGSSAAAARSASARPAPGSLARAGGVGAYGMAPGSSAQRQGTGIASASAYRTASSVSSYAMSGGSSSPSRIAGPSPHLASRPYGAPASSMATGVYGSRGIAAAGTTATRTIKTQRESFRPRPSIVAKVGSHATVVGGGGLPVMSRTMVGAGASGPRLSPGRASKWGDMGPPAWPGAGAGAMARQRDVSCISASSSIHTDITTVIHPGPHGGIAMGSSSQQMRMAAAAEPAKRTRRAPSMSLEACLADLAASSSYGKARIGDAGRDDGICSIRSVPSSENIARVTGWKDGLRIAGAGLDDNELIDDDDVPDIDARQADVLVEEQPSLPRSGSSNWELVGEAEPESHPDNYHSYGNNAALAA
ncbi:hypothetical protein BCV70DRAFT_199824 [Testicularia cyperi]|uniref:Microtubule associated protein n=1 Tax=Testicularia cyperi TaxID=1882483 RepID=A0A317XR25_9BASI|nr:hypothetical protein BCV70DRAFT_199824 [Testicularia cyperi]